MDLTITDLEKLLLLSRSEINKFIHKKEIPFQKIRDVFYFNKQQVVDWALGRNMPLNLSESVKMSDYRVETLKPLLGPESFHYGCELAEGDYIDKIVGLIKLDKGVDKDIVIKLLKGREELMSTAIGNGISIPHPRVPLMLGGNRPIINFFFPARPLDLKSLDARPVHTIILLVSQTIKQHLSLLAHISFLLSKTEFRQALENRMGYEKIMEMISSIEGSRHA